MPFNDIDRSLFKQQSPSQQNMTTHPIRNHITFTASYIASPSSDPSMNNLSPFGIRHETIARRNTSLLFNSNSLMPSPPTSTLPRAKQQI
jgi:hypothetical protein